MDDVLLKDKNEILLRGKVSDISPMGVECDVELDDMDRLRDESGKFRKLDLEVKVQPHSGDCAVSGSGMVYSVRRISQSRCMVVIRFIDLEQNGYRLISEHLSPSPLMASEAADPEVVDLATMRTARQSRRA